MFLDTKKHLCFWDGAPCFASKLAPRIPTDHLAVAQAPTTNSWLHNSLVIMGNPRGFSDWLCFLLSTGNLRKKHLYSIYTLISFAEDIPFAMLASQMFQSSGGWKPSKFGYFLDWFV